MKRLLTVLMALLLAACAIAPSQSTPSATYNSTSSPSQTMRLVANPSTTPIPTLIPSPTPTPEALLRNGNKAFFTGDYSRAETEFRAALSSATDQETYTLALWYLGRIEYLAGNNGKALEDLKSLATRYPDSPDAARANFLMGEIYMSGERYAEAAQAFTTYLTKRPNILDSFVQERLGDAYNANGNYSEAISAYKTALASPHLGDETAYENQGSTGLRQFWRYNQRA